MSGYMSRRHAVMGVLVNYRLRSPMKTKHFRENSRQTSTNLNFQKVKIYTISKLFEGCKVRRNSKEQVKIYYEENY